MVEEGQERSGKYRDTEQLGRLLVWGYLAGAEGGSDLGKEWLVF
jgi:hypothetical protein